MLCVDIHRRTSVLGGLKMDSFISTLSPLLFLPHGPFFLLYAVSFGSSVHRIIRRKHTTSDLILLLVSSMIAAVYGLIVVELWREMELIIRYCIHNHL